MNFQTSALGVTVAIAAVASTQTSILAVTKLDVIHESLMRSTTQVPTTELTSPARSLSVNPSRQTFFDHSPRLIRSVARQTGGHVPSSYEFTITVPDNAGQALKAVTISQAENLEALRFDANESQAFIGQRLARRTEIPLSSIGGSQSSNPSEITIAFDQPVQPGNTVTVAVQSEANPTFGGVYLFSVTAYPVGENSLGQFLGYGRINFYGNSN